MERNTTFSRRTVDIVKEAMRILNETNEDVTSSEGLYYNVNSNVILEHEEMIVKNITVNEHIEAELEVAKNLIENEITEVEDITEVETKITEPENNMTTENEIEHEVLTTVENVKNITVNEHIEAELEVAKNLIENEITEVKDITEVEAKITEPENNMTTENEIEHEVLTTVENVTENEDINIHYGRPKKGRKRKYENQDRKVRKLHNIQNKTFVTQSGKVKERKEFRHYVCKCNCYEKIGDTIVKEEFNKFYNVTSHETQTALLNKMISEEPVKRKRAKGSKKRHFTRVYKICDTQVCKAFFLQTFRISSCKVDKALKKMKSSFGVSDRRGITGGKNKMSEQTFNEVINHINKFPRYKSHYRRSDTQSEFLSPDITLPKMYSLYKLEVNQPVSMSSYKKIFLTKFNLKRKQLKKDTCNICDRLAAAIQNAHSEEEKAELKEKQDSHWDISNDAQKLRNKDMENAKTDPELETICFDLERTLPLPRISSQVAYYKRQLWVYNLGVHVGKNDKAHCYVWHEGEAGRGAQEVGSCLIKHLKNEVHTAKHAILWSDSCGGQNRNIKIVLLLKQLLQMHSSLKRITMRFLYPGHTFLPCDSDFGDIENCLSTQQNLFTVEDYMQIMRDCRKKNKMTVHRMPKEEFFSSELLEKAIVNRKKDTHNNKVNWLNIREISFTKEENFSIFIKTSFSEEESREISFKKSGRKAYIPLLQPLWPQGKPISKEKMNDLKSLMCFIPQVSKPFFTQLKCNENLQDDIDGFGAELDFEVQDESDIN